MAYDNTIPVDSLPIPDIPDAIRTKGEDVIELLRADAAITPSAGKTPKADSNAKIAAGWLPTNTALGVAGLDAGAKVPAKYLPMPVGAQFFMCSGDVPTNCLLCNGATVSRATYAELFAAIGTTFGAGDGSTTFALPDLRGKFLRGTGGNAAELGTEQGDAIRNIWGSAGILGYSSNEMYIATDGHDGAFRAASTGSAYIAKTSEVAKNNNGIYLDASRVVPTAIENRPVNIALTPVIIYA